MRNIILEFAPVWLQNAFISAYNALQYRLRRGGVYTNKKVILKGFDKLGENEILDAQNKRLSSFLSWVNKNSDWYKSIKSGAELSDYPVLEKSSVLSSLDKIATIEEKKAVVSLTGGTTGASMKVLYTKNDTQERHALLDHFRESYGYTLGKKVAWFSGKNLTREKDLAKGICYRDDWINKIRFFSTFHICEKYFDAYWKALEDFAPEFMVGFPSSVYDICVMAKAKGLKYKGKVKVFFPTAETVLSMHRELIGEVLGCRLANQYASSEGAPFILECHHGSMHIHPLSGVFEVVDSHLKPAREGEMLVTSFTTHGTPLIRYRIGDRMKLAPEDYRCECGSVFPVVEYIDGRTSDFVLSPENGRVNLGNISNCTKDIAGIICFQVQQDSVNKVLVRIVATDDFDKVHEANFIRALAERLGPSMEIIVERVPEIRREASGKFRIVKNNL